MVEKYSKIDLFTDGGSRNNPGHAAIGVVLKNTEGAVILERSEYVGIKTNNEAEYLALLAGLQAAKEHVPDILHCYLDSELVVNQLRGTYRVKNENLKKLVEEVFALKSLFREITFVHIPRSKNKEADTLVNRALDSRGIE
jgi:ribonuclease HI